MKNVSPVGLIVGALLVGALGGLVGQQTTARLTAQAAPPVYTIRSVSADRFVTAWDTFQGQHPLIANRTAAYAGEEFELVCVRHCPTAAPAPTPTPTPIPVPPAGAYWLDRDYILGQLFATVYGPYHAVPGPRGTGPLDSDYYIDQIVATGGWRNPIPTTGENNIGYWTSRISSDLERAGYRK